MLAPNAVAGPPVEQTAASSPSGQPAGPQLGPFSLDGTISMSTMVDDNLFATRNNPKSDVIGVVSPGIRLESNWAHDWLALFGGGEFGRHREYGSENYNDAYAGFDGRFDLTDQTQLIGGLRYDHTHEPRTSPDDENGKRPTIYNDTQAYAGIYQAFDKFWLRAGGTAEWLNFSDVGALSGGTINNDDRDRVQNTAGGRLGYSVRPGWDFFAQGSFDWRRYRQQTDDSGFERDSSGWRGSIGLVLSLPGNSEFEANVGYLWQNYRDARFGHVAVPDFGAKLRWNVSPTIAVRGRVSRSIEETTEFGSAGYIRTAYGAGLEYRLRPNTILDTSISYSENDYLNVNRVDNLIDFNAEVRRYLSPYFYVAGGYRFSQRDSNLSGQDYDDNIFMLRLGAQLKPAYDDAALAADDAQLAKALPWGLPGLYFGAQAGLGEIHTALDGTRAKTGTLTSDFGDHGITGGIFGGYGISLSRWHVGFEVEADGSNAGWDHRRLPGGRIFAVDKDWTVGAAARVGYALPSGALVYGRAGPVITQFDTTYLPPSKEDQGRKLWRFGARVGGGIEVPVGNGLFTRLDYTYTSYNDYNTGPKSGADNFTNSESLARIGIGYRFGAMPAPQSDFHYDFARPYIGVQAGFGGITTINRGPREDDSILTADRGGHGGVAGVFGGIGWVWNGVYVGGEAELDTSYMGWDIERDPQGRVYSVDRRESVGGAVRAGYVLGDNTLLYARGGLVRTRFRTEYANGNFHTKQDDWRTGWRFGGGVETGLDNGFALRFDYTYTLYGTYSVDYPAGQDTFDNAESMLRAGILYRF